MSQDILAKLNRLGGKAKPQAKWEDDEVAPQAAAQVEQEEETEQDEDDNQSEDDESNDEEDIEDESSEEDSAEDPIAALCDEAEKTIEVWERVADRVAHQILTGLRDALSRVVDGQLYE